MHDQLGDLVTRLLENCEADVSVCVAESMLEVLEAGARFTHFVLRTFTSTSTSHFHFHFHVHFHFQSFTQRVPQRDAGTNTSFA